MTLFPKYTDNGIQFPVTQVMQIELGLMVAVALMGIAIQLRVLKLLQRKLREISEMQKKRNEEEERRAAERFASLDMEKQEWEAQRKSILHHGRNDSDFSSAGLLAEGKGSPSSTPVPDDHTTLVGGQRPRYQSGVSEFMTDEGRRSQSPGAIPALDLGNGIEGSVPRDYLADSKEINRIEEEIRAKEKLRQEIEDIRKSIVYLEDVTPTRSHRPSLPSPIDRNGSHSRANSLELGAMIRAPSTTVVRPKSAPIPEDWDAYVRDRKLLQPPAGVSPPIPVTQPPMTQRASISSAVLDAVANRQKIESTFGVRSNIPIEATSSQPHQPIPQGSQDEDIPLALAVASNSKSLNSKSHVRSKSTGPPLTILPPQKASPPYVSQEEKGPSPRVATYEELAERHQRKIRDMQAPLTKVEREAAELEDAKRRWERAKALEKVAVTKRQADMAAALARDEKKKKKEQRSGSGSGPELMADDGKVQPTRSLSADRLGTLPGGSMNANPKRISVMKVEDWKRSQLEQGSPDEMGLKKRDSVPFPQNTTASHRKSGSGYLVKDPPR